MAGIWPKETPMTGVSRQDWWDEGEAETQPGQAQPVVRESWFLAFLAAAFFTLLFSVGLDLVLRLAEEGRLRVPAGWLERVDLGIGLGLFFLGASVGLAFGRVGRLSGARPAAASFLLALSGMGYLLLLQSGLVQQRVLDVAAADLQQWLQARSIAIYGLALLGLSVAWFLPFRARRERC